MSVDLYEHNQTAYKNAVTMLDDCKKDDNVPVITWYMSMPEAQCRDQAIIEEAANKIIEPAVGAKLKFCIAKSDEGSFVPVTIDGKIYAIPSQTPWVNENVIVFKKDLVDKYNFDYKSVKSIRDLEPYLEKIKQNEPGIHRYLQLRTVISTKN